MYVLLCNILCYLYWIMIDCLCSYSVSIIVIVLLWVRVLLSLEFIGRNATLNCSVKVLLFDMFFSTVCISAIT